MKFKRKKLQNAFICTKSRIKRTRMTLVEIMFALFLTTLLISVAYPIIFGALKQSKAATWQAQFLAEARTAQQKINRLVQRSKYVEMPNSQTVSLYSADNVRTDIHYKTDDNGQGILELETEDEPKKILCRHVTPVSDDEPLFTLQNEPRQSLYMALHIGDPPNGGENEDRTGPGYQGVEIRFSSSPKDLQEWHD